MNGKTERNGISGWIDFFRQLDENHLRLLKALALVSLVLLVGTIGYRFLSPGLDDGQGGRKPVGWLDCAYMTVISLTTVGYSEMVPVQPHPHMIVFTCCLLLGGVAVLTYAFSAITAFVVEGTLKEAFWKRKMEKKLANLSDHFIVCGAEETSLTVIRELHQTKRDFVVVDTDAGKLKELVEKFNACIVEGDPTDEAALAAAGISRARGLLAILPTDRDNLFLVVTAKQLNAKMRIVAKVADPANNQKFLKAGADDLASPQVIGGLRLVSQLIRPTVVGFLDVMLRDKDQAIRIEEVEMQAGSQYEGSSLRSASFQQKFGVQVLASQPKGAQRFDYTPDPDEPIVAGTTLVVLGDTEHVKRLRQALSPS
jgi:voltage-gated potassium channel